MPIRILTSVPICDGHDSAINTVNLELTRNGIEVVYLGFNRSADAIARAAIQEDVVAIGISTYNGGHVEFFDEVLQHLRQRRVEPEVTIFGGGGGTITGEDAEIMSKRGVDRIFFAGTPLTEMLTYVKTRYGAVHQPRYDISFRGAVARLHVSEHFRERCPGEEDSVDTALGHDLGILAGNCPAASPKDCHLRFDPPLAQMLENLVKKFDMSAVVS